MTGVVTMPEEQGKENQENNNEIDREEAELLVKLIEMALGENPSWQERETLNRLRNWARNKTEDRER
jgi:hypothetical protein